MNVARHNTIGERIWGARQEYLARVSPSYDETLHDVIAAIAASGSVGKADIGALLFWKRLRADTRWASSLHELPDAQVRTVTTAAVQAARDTSLPLTEAARQGRSALGSLPGFQTGDALASAILLAAAPERMAVYDRRAHAGLTSLGIDLDFKAGRYSRYMAALEWICDDVAAAGHLMTPREVDTALYWIGR